MGEDGFEDMRPVPVPRAAMEDSGLLDRAARAHAALARAREEIRLYLDVDGVPTSIHECDWILVKSCGCVCSIMHACSLGEIYATEDDAWHEIYDIEPHPHKRVRERDIRRMKAEGWTVRATTRDEAVRLFRMKPDHRHEGGKTT
jgi:hypothetical protein